jgi:hypothetical protein
MRTRPAYVRRGPFMMSADMTPDEYQRAVFELTDQAYKDFQRWGAVGDRSRDKAVEEFAYSPEPEQWGPDRGFSLARARRLVGADRIREDRGARSAECWGSRSLRAGIR